MKLSRLLLYVLTLCVLALAAVPGKAQAAIQIGYSDLDWDLNVAHYQTKRLSDTLAKAKASGATMVRINVPWRAMVLRNDRLERPALPQYPNDPRYNQWQFARLDYAIREAHRRGLTPYLMVYAAPKYAMVPPVDMTPDTQEEKDIVESFSRGAWMPIPSELQLFAQALAVRYSGHWKDPNGSGYLPIVHHYEGWVEPNSSDYLAPQGTEAVPIGPNQYKNLLNAFYKGINGAIMRDGIRNTVIAGGTAPAARSLAKANRATVDMHPKAFWRAVFCQNASGKRISGCSNEQTKIKFDIFSHHPINGTIPSWKQGAHPDEVRIADMPELIAILRRAEAQKTIATPGTHPVWATEVWWNGVSEADQAAFMWDGLRRLESYGVQRATFLQVRDRELPNPFNNSVYHTGIYRRDGTPKPSQNAMAAFARR